MVPQYSFCRQIGVLFRIGQPIFKKSPKFFWGGGHFQFGPGQKICHIFLLKASLGTSSNNKTQSNLDLSKSSLPTSPHKKNNFES